MEIYGLYPEAVQANVEFTFKIKGSEPEHPSG
jgi:hypothetical protein